MTHSPRALIHLQNIVDNWQTLDRLNAATETGAVVKANAYGHGISDISKALAKAGCRSFFTATVSEALHAREALGDGPEIFVLHGCALDDVEDVRNARLRPILNTLNQVRTWRVGSLSDVSPACLHFDTGMNRLGLRMEQLDDTRTMLDGRPVDLVMSHLACADDAQNTMNMTQRGRFLECCGYWPGARRSLSNTAGMHLGANFAFDLTRPGIGLYGGGVSPLKPGLTLEAPLLSVFTVPKASSTGYGATRRFQDERRLAAVALGYADGYLRSASNTGFAYIGETRCPVVGRVSMDLVTLDVTAVKAPIAPGTLVEFIGSRAKLEDQAKAAGTLGYELITGLSDRVARQCT